MSVRDLIPKLEFPIVELKYLDNNQTRRDAQIERAIPMHSGI
jgi:hypothetical protein